jgi:hypothetical protein
MNLQEHIRKVLKEIRVPREERVQLYKDDNIIVVVPLTHRALQKYAHRCQWCINDDKDEWEDYHKGLHAVIIQRNPKKIKIGITGNPVPTEIFIMDRWDEGGYRFKDVCDILNHNFKDEVDMKDYYTTILNDINNFGTNIVYYSPSNELYDQEDNYLGGFNYKISDIPNVTPEVIKIMDEYLTKEEFERPDAPKRNQQELDEYARTLKNARQQGVGLRFPKSAIKSNPSRFRPYNRKGVNESDLETKQNDKRIVCEKCGWSWDLSEGGDDPYTCHKCGNENHKSELTEKCWKGYTQKGMKTMFGKKYPNCVKNKKSKTNLQESIRRIIREETKLNPMILRRVRRDDLEREFEESLDDTSNSVFHLIRNGGGIMVLDRFKYITVSRLIDGIHYEIYSTTPEDSEWYDEVFNSLKDYYTDRIEVRYKKLMSEI